MEAIGILDPTNEVDLFVLQCVFLPRINKALIKILGHGIYILFEQQGIGLHTK